MNHADIADKLGQIAADIADLTARQTALKQQLIEAGVQAVEGSLFRATVTEVVPSDRIDYASLVARLAPSRQMLTAYTHPATPYTRVTIKARTAA